MPEEWSMRVIAGDIGGTKTLLAVVDVKVNESSYELIEVRRFESRRYESLGSLVKEFAQETDANVTQACFGVAGPVVGGEWFGTNLPWHIVTDRLAEETGIRRAGLINDFEAIGNGLELMKPSDLAVLQESRPKPRAAIALIGAGTGLGEGFLVWQDGRYRGQPSEGGHTDFGPRNDLEIGLLKFLWKTYGHVSYERMVSGPGLAGIYRFLIESGVHAESLAVRNEMEGKDAAPIVSGHGLAGDDPACVTALDMFVSIYGAEAGNLALKVLAEGGVYITGGIAPHIVDKLKDGTFLQAFRDKGRLSPVVENLPVSVILNSNVGLLGAALAAARFE
jgi:glucokinase